MEKPWKLIFLLVGIFAAGVVTGGFVVNMRFGRRPPLRPRMESWRDSDLKVLADRLGLSNDEVEKLKPVVKPFVDQMAKVRTNWINETRPILEQLEHAVAAVLTPEQKVRFDEMNREQQERMKRFMRDRGQMRGPRDHGGDEPPPGPPPDKT